MVEYNIKITPQAFDHLQEIRNYIECELNAPAAAKKLLLLFKHKMNQLALMPQSYRTIEEEPWRSQGVRKSSANNYYIYYWIDAVNKEVHILAVIYNKRDQYQQLLELMESEL